MNNEVSTGKAILMTIGILLLIGWIGKSLEPKCIKSGCDNNRTEGSSYCYTHSLSSNSYKYNNYHSNSNNDSKETTNTQKSDSNSSYQSNRNHSSSTSNSYHSYDEGYDDIYMDDDYDWERYNRDSDYANGVDDAMDEFDW